MALRDQPYLPLYVQDFLTDEKLAECSAQATGVYIRIMCLMHKSEQYGQILLKQKHKQTDKQILNFASMLVKHLPYDVSIISSSLTELIDEGVLLLEDDCLTQKRMVKDYQTSINRAISGKKGGKKSLGKKEVSDEDFAQANLQANSENENEIHSIGNISNSNDKGGMGENGKLKYADYVTMTEKEYERLCCDYGQDAPELINILNNYKGSKGKTYKSDYLAIKNWVVDRLKEKKVSAGQPLSKVEKMMSALNNAKNGFANN
ncbi:MAG: hypothetical protein WC833_08800 [Bacteroidales bacterium]|jgi:uncharacterized protein YdaU (DUF1376 family)